MPDLPLAQQIFLAGVVIAFSAFIIVVGGTHIYVNLPSKKRDQASR
jgi:hypothetical protein